MTLVYMDKLPERKTRKYATHGRDYNKLQAMINQFVDSGEACALVKISDGEYTSLDSAYATIREAVRDSKRLVQVRLRGDDIYLVKKEV